MALAKEAEERWSRMLEDPVPKVQMEALTQIGRSYFRAPEETLAEIDLGGPVRTGGTEERTLPETLRDGILKKLQSEDPDMRAEAVLALVHCQDEETIEKIKETLNDSNRTVRLAAIQSLATMRQPRFTGALLKVAQNDSAEMVRAQAVAAIDWIGRCGKVKGQQERSVRAVRTKGELLIPLAVLDSLEALGDEDPSRYVSFLARKAHQRLTE